ALQILPHLLTKSLRKTTPDKEAVILVATSGDTGKAALEGFKDVDGTKIMVFYPVDGVSPMQKRQMTTQEGKNVAVCAIKGNFDDAQTGVKRIFTDSELVKTLDDNGYLFSSANSINWGRLLPQIVYYFSAYCEMVNSGKINLGDKINVAVPTGNFGNILASYYAFRMGLPVNKFICASNSNNVLTDFIADGTYDKNRSFYATISPSMDILVSSNLECFLYHMTDCNDKKVKEWMTALKTKGAYTVDDETKEKITSIFTGGFCDDEKTKQIIGEFFGKYGYLCDTHTAVAVSVYKDYVESTGDRTPTIVDSTASPYKFSKAVLESVAPNAKLPADEFEMTELLSSTTSTAVPAPLAALKSKETRFTNVCAKEEMADFVLNTLGVK
ncbi:MAG: threonine synthase, partial [Clostridia bacterium]|nr:threonine synthase [Clostridia bacterium]